MPSTTIGIVKFMHVHGVHVNTYCIVCSKKVSTITTNVLLKRSEQAPEFRCLLDLLRCYGEVLHGQSELEVLALQVSQYLSEGQMYLHTCVNIIQRAQSTEEVIRKYPDSALFYGDVYLSVDDRMSHMYGMATMCVYMCLLQGFCRGYTPCVHLDS